jgi:hypothetical protein
MSDISTTPQNWQQKYTKNKPLRKAKETVYAGISVTWFYIVGVFAIITVLATFPLIFIHNIIFQCLIVSLIVVLWAVYLIYFRTSELYYETMLKVRFILDEYMGKHQICKFDMPLEELQTYIPIINVLQNGVIQFTQKRYGILINIGWQNITDEEMERHLINIQSIINRLSGDMMIKFIASSRFGTPSPLLKKLERKMNDPQTAKADFNLLLSQYDRIKNGKVTPDWDFKVFLGLGTCESIDAAQEKLMEELPGIMDVLPNAEVIMNRNEIAKQYIQFMVPRDLI